MTTVLHGEELWVTDGTAEGTRLAADIHPIRLNPSSSPRSLTAVGERVFFAVYHQRWGKELWVSDGTYKGTRLVRDIAPGPAGSSPSDLTAVGHQLYFTAHTEIHGHELWASDGSAEGTRLVRDIRAGPEGSDPHNLCTDGEALFFAARDDGGDERVWRYAPSDASLVAARASATEYKRAHIVVIFYLFDKVYAYLVDDAGDAHLYRVVDEQVTLNSYRRQFYRACGDPAKGGCARISTPGARRWHLAKPNSHALFTRHGRTGRRALRSR